MSNRKTQFRDDAWRVPQRVQQPQPGSTASQTQQTNQGSGYSYILTEYKNNTPINTAQPAPFSQDQIKIPYSTFQRAGPHNARSGAKPAASSATYSQSQMDRLRQDYEQKQTQSRGRAREYSLQQEGSRRRSGSLTRFINWIERKLSGSEISRPTTSGSGSSSLPATSDSDSVRPSTAPGKSPAAAQRQLKPPVSTGIRASFESERNSRCPASSQQRRQPPPSASGYVQVEPHHEQKPAGFDYSRRDTTGTTWTNFLEITKQQTATPSRPPPIPAHPTRTTTPARKPVPTTSPSPQPSISSASNTSSNHSKKSSASNILHKVAHPLQRRDSGVSEMSFFCSGVDDEALEITSKKRADIIDRQKQQRKDADKRREQEALEREKNNPVFAAAKRRQEAEEEARLEARLQESMNGSAHTNSRCCICELNSPMRNTDVCRRCADAHPGIADKRVSRAVGQDLSALTGPDSLRATSTIYNVDLSTYAGGPGARPPSSIYPSRQSRPLSGYTVGNPYGDVASQVPPPVPALPKDYEGAKSQDREPRDTRFYEEIDEVHGMYRSGAPKMPEVPPKWRSARASGTY